MIKERNEMLEKFKQWFTISSTDFETDPINQKIFFIDCAGNEILFFINSKTLVWAYRLKGTKEFSYRQHINNIDKKMKKLGIVKNNLQGSQ